MCTFKPIWIYVLLVCLIFAACWGSPVGLRQENGSLQDSKDEAPARSILCIQTPYGCVDLSTLYRPKDKEGATKGENSLTDENGDLDSIYTPPCIPTPWGCIDPSDPGIRPK